MAAFFMINENTHSEAIRRLSSGNYSGPNISGARAVDLSDCGFHGEAIRLFAKLENLSQKELGRYISSLARHLDYDTILDVSNRTRRDLSFILEQVSQSKLVFEMITQRYIDIFVKNAEHPYEFKHIDESEGLDRQELIRRFNHEKSLEYALEIALRANKEKNISESAFFINFLVQNRAINNSVLGLFLAFLEAMEQARSIEYITKIIAKVDYYNTEALKAVRAQALILLRDRKSASRLIEEFDKNSNFGKIAFQLHDLIGNHDHVKTIIKSSLQQNPEYPSNIFAAIKHGVELPSASVAKLLALSASNDLDAYSLAVLADYYNNKAQYSQAFALYARANEVELKKFPFSINAERMEIESVALSVNSLPVLVEFSDYKPIFIVGLPRSGTSVVEKLCADSLQNYICLGESSAISMFIKQFGVPLSKIDLLKLANFYFSHNHIENEPLFIDKMPLNFKYLGLIKKIFPKARIIRCKKDIKRNAWSLYKKIFKGKGNSFSNSTSAIESYIDLERETMRYWNLRIKDIHEICNEDLVTSNSAVLTRLSLFLETKVMFQKRSEHLTFTASKNQLQNLQESLDFSYKNYTEFWHYLNEDGC